MRQAQMKDALMKSKGVERVCQDLLETDREFSHGVGKHYLEKLYILDNGSTKLPISKKGPSVKPKKGYFASKGQSFGGYQPQSSVLSSSIGRTNKTIHHI